VWRGLDRVFCRGDLAPVDMKIVYKLLEPCQ
jgi:hypothetical protein